MRIPVLGDMLLGQDTKTEYVAVAKIMKANEGKK